VEAPVEGAGHPGGRLGWLVVLFLFFVSGFAALLLEVTWIRHAGLIYGSGLHAFAVVVVAFLLGLAVGSACYEAFLARVRDQVVLFSVIDLSAGATALLVTALFPRMEAVFLALYHATSSYLVFSLTLVLGLILLLLAPTMLMGMTLPALAAAVASRRQLGRDFGRLYAVNSVGALCGSFLAGFVVIPALGIHGSAWLAAGLYLFVSVAFLVCFRSSAQTLRRVGLAVCGVLLATAVTYGFLRSPNHLYNGAYYSVTMADPGEWRGIFAKQKELWPYMRFFATGRYGQVAAYGSGSELVLRSNGRIDSSTGPDCRPYQTMIGHIPVLVHRRPRRALNIGLGAGWTVAAMAEHDEVESVDSVEINPLIVDVNRSVFHLFNGDVLNHPKVTSIVNDGRNYVAHTSRRYDVIVSEPPEFWQSGVAALFTREFYRAADRALNEHGMLCQWFPRYEVAEEDYRLALKTLRTVFSHTYEFDMARITGDTRYQSYLILASKQPVPVQARLAEHRSRVAALGDAQAEARARLIGLVERAYSRNDEELGAYVASVETVNTDDRPILEYRAARYRFRKFRDP